MGIPSGPRIVLSDRLDNGIVVSFDDGRTVRYPAALLYSVVSQAEELPLDSERNLPL
jgi:hypothetical protein